MRQRSELLSTQSEESPATLAQLRGEIERVRSNAKNPTVIKRMDIVEGILDGIGIARVQADAGNVIKGYVELAKILGLNVPEQTKPELTHAQRHMRSKLEGLSDEQLYDIATGANIIEGEVIEANQENTD